MLFIKGNELRKVKHLKHGNRMTASHEGCWQRHHGTIQRKRLKRAIATIPINCINRVMAYREQAHIVSIIQARENPEMIVNVESTLIKLRGHPIEEAACNRSVAHMSDQYDEGLGIL